jgi:hypothetical protein
VLVASDFASKPIFSGWSDGEIFGAVPGLVVVRLIARPP